MRRLSDFGDEGSSPTEPAYAPLALDNPGTPVVWAGSRPAPPLSTMLRLPYTSEGGSTLPLSSGVETVPSPTTRLLLTLQVPGNGSVPANNTNSSGGGGTKWDIVESETQRRNGPLEAMWMSVYWITFLLTYVIVPVVQEYVVAGEFESAVSAACFHSHAQRSDVSICLLPPRLTLFLCPGDFTAREKFNSAVWANVLFYLICGVLGLAGLIFIVWYYGPTQVRTSTAACFYYCCF